MKVKIGGYLHWWGPYQLVDALFFWQEKYPNDKLAARWDYRLNDKLSTWLADTWVASACSWVYEKRKRTIKVHIDNYDVWSADYTMSLIAVPLLKKLKEVKHGAPYVDLADVPKHLHPTKKQQEKYAKEHSTDPKFFKRFDWILDEMIWAHEQIISDDGDGQFYDHSLADDPNDDLNTQIRKIKVDRKGLKAYHERIDNGLRLYGKYYRALWD